MLPKPINTKEGQEEFNEAVKKLQKEMNFNKDNSKKMKDLMEKINESRKT